MPTIKAMIECKNCGVIYPAYRNSSNHLQFNDENKIDAGFRCPSCHFFEVVYTYTLTELQKDLANEDRPIPI